MLVAVVFVLSTTRNKIIKIVVRFPFCVSGTNILPVWNTMERCTWYVTVTNGVRLPNISSIHAGTRLTYTKAIKVP